MRRSGGRTGLGVVDTDCVRWHVPCRPGGGGASVFDRRAPGSRPPAHNCAAAPTPAPRGRSSTMVITLQNHCGTLSVHWHRYGAGGAGTDCSALSKRFHKAPSGAATPPLLGQRPVFRPLTPPPPAPIPLSARLTDLRAADMYAYARIHVYMYTRIRIVCRHPVYM